MAKVYKVKGATLSQFTNILKSCSKLATDSKHQKLYNEIARMEKTLKVIAIGNRDLSHNPWARFKEWLSWRHPNVWWLLFHKDL